jgi:hypothetical protein
MMIRPSSQRAGTSLVTPRNHRPGTGILRMGAPSNGDISPCTSTSTVPSPSRVAREFPLDDIATAHELVEEGRQVGGVVVTI